MKGPDPAATALALAIYALHDTLVDSGVLSKAAVATTLRRFTHDDPELMAFVLAIAAHLDQRPFQSVERKGFEVIDGGLA